MDHIRHDLDKAPDERQNLERACMGTFCIDKRSSAELSNAIKPMCQLDALSAVCLVFLPEVHELGITEIADVCQ